MKINWKVRINNPMFWVQIVLAVFTPILAYFGFNWEDMTTWAAICNLFVQAVQNPVVVVSVVVSVYNAIIDPTTQGMGDSARALTYETPSK
ncbi:MAG: phage holin [Faecousia sp.]